MAFRSGAAICGAVITLVISVAAARSDIGAAHSNDVDKAASGAAIVGAASMYNPYKPGWRRAARIPLPDSVMILRVGGCHQNQFAYEIWRVQYGASPKFALVEAAGKKVIVKINDGAARARRVIDFNERTMRHFDPSLEQGVIYGVKVTPLSGDH